ncbi:TIGR02757 family protein [bacterium]|nr:TIGR02757 family protein [bacterium]
MSLKPSLDSLYKSYDAAYLDMDPLGLVKRYERPGDQEVAGFIAAVMALGRWEQIRRVVSEILERMGSSPKDFVMGYYPSRHGNPFEDLRHRFYSGRDIGLLVYWLAQIARQEGGIEAFYMKGHNAGDIDVGPGLSAFVRNVARLDIEPFYNELPAPGRGASHFLTDPFKGSAAKRLCLFLRWMVRTDNIDLGIWKSVSPAQLIIPLDVHITRLSRRLGLTRRSTPGWRMAVEITSALRALDREDPVKYDFALCTLGKLDPCNQAGKCQTCPIGQGCHEYSS